MADSRQTADDASGSRGPIKAVGVSKIFPGVRALTDVSLEMKPGVVTGLVGPNGSGKSTLIGILTGRLTPSEGHIEDSGERVVFRNVRESIDRGIQLITQELTIAPGLTIAENLLVGRFPHGRFGLDLRRLRLQASEIAERVGLEHEVGKSVDELSPAEMRLVMIGRAASWNCRYLIMDEPSASLSPREVERIVDITRDFAHRGVGVLYVSHRLSEVVSLCSDVTVLRDGKLVHESSMQDMKVRDLIRLMSDVDHTVVTGDDAQEISNVAPDSPVVIRATDLRRGIVKGVDLEVRQGEILGVAGLVGSGRTELVRMLAGADKPERGTLEWGGAPAKRHTIREALRHGIVLLPEDRRYQGGFQDLSVATNVSLPSLRSMSWRNFVLRLRQEYRVVCSALTQVDVPLTRIKHPMRVLSGGNQQKVAIAKWLLTEPRVFIFDEPTAGIDVHAKENIRQELRRLAAGGAAVVVVSSDNEEFRHLCDRLVVMHEGVISGALVGSEITPTAILELSYGGAIEVPTEDAALG